MPREQAFNEMMESLFEMTRYVSLFENTLYRYRGQELYTTEVHALNEIGRRASTNMTQLAQLTHRTKGAVSQMIAKLEKKGLVQKQVSPTNKSEVLLALTAEGRAVCEYHHVAEQRIYKMYLDGMGDFSQEEFLRASQILNRIRQITVDKTSL